MRLELKCIQIPYFHDIFKFFKTYQSIFVINCTDLLAYRENYTFFQSNKSYFHFLFRYGNQSNLKILKQKQSHENVLIIILGANFYGLIIHKSQNGANQQICKIFFDFFLEFAYYQIKFLALQVLNHAIITLQRLILKRTHKMYNFLMFGFKINSQNFSIKSTIYKFQMIVKTENIKTSLFFCIFNAASPYIYRFLFDLFFNIINLSQTRVTSDFKLFRSHFEEECEALSLNLPLLPTILFSFYLQKVIFSIPFGKFTKVKGKKSLISLPSSNKVFRYLQFILERGFKDTILLFAKFRHVYKGPIFRVWAHAMRPKAICFEFSSLLMIYYHLHRFSCMRLGNLIWLIHAKIGEQQVNSALFGEYSGPFFIRLTAAQWEKGCSTCQLQTIYALSSAMGTDLPLRTADQISHYFSIRIERIRDVFVLLSLEDDSSNLQAHYYSNNKVFANIQIYINQAKLILSLVSTFSAELGSDFTFLPLERLNWDSSSTCEVLQLEWYLLKQKQREFRQF